ARMVIAEVNEQVPFTFGEMLPASRIDVAVQVSRPPVEAPAAKIGETDEAIARFGARSPGGRSIIALPATAKGGKLSRITPTLSGPVTTARSDVDVIVTEFGAAELK